MTKILFLDFDGVLNDYSYNNTENFQSDEEYYTQKKSTKNFIWNNLKDSSHNLWVLSDLDYHKIKLLNQIVHQTNCKIVFSTSWRGDGTNNLALYLAIMGFMYPENCIDCTGYGRNGIRGLEISDWLIKYISETDEEVRYAILDDEMVDIKDYHSEVVRFKTDGQIAGLTEDIVDRVVEWLNKENII